MDKPKSFQPLHVGRDMHPRRRDEASHLRGKHKWTLFSIRFRGQHPMCFDPYRIHMPGFERSTCVHHIIPLAEKPDLIYDQKNCAALCYHCHARIETQERFEGPTQYLFKKGPSHAV